MATSVQGHTARIYQFPVPKRPSLPDQLGDAHTPAAPAPRGLRIASGHAWYHEAALPEVEQPKK